MGSVFSQTLFDDPSCRFEYVLKILTKFRGKNHTLILPNELFSLKLVELLQMQHQFKCLVMLLQEPGTNQQFLDLPIEFIKEPFIHNSIVHPIMPFLPKKTAIKLHDKNGEWAFKDD